MADVDDSISRVVIDVDTKLKHIRYVKSAESVDVRTGQIVGSDQRVYYWVFGIIGLSLLIVIPLLWWGVIKKLVATGNSVF